MSIFDHFISKAMGEQERKASSPTPTRKLLSDLETTGEEAKAQYPNDSKTVDDFVEVLKEAYKARYKKAASNERPPMKAEARFFLSEDRMCAWACVFPPENNGEGMAVEEFLGEMRYEGITHGILQEEVQQKFGYLRIFPIARGKLPQAGEDGKVTELFQRNKSIGLELHSEGRVDFGEDIQLQPIRKGTPICMIRPPRPGIDGMDVAGQPLPCPPVAEADVPQGENTIISRGGQALTANVDGLLYIRDDLFCVHEQKVIDGNLNQFQGTLLVSTNLYVAGDVDGGVVIEASGDVVIKGKVGQARITSIDGTIRVQKGIYGVSGQTFLSACYQVQAPTIEGAEVHAGNSVITEMISNSKIRCDGSVYALSGRGMIVGSVIQARDDILCLRIGNLAGERSRFSIGYPLDCPESWERIKAELAEAQVTIKKLWTYITDIRKKSARMSDGEKSVLDQLVQQRNLYLEKREALTAELNTVSQMLDRKSKGKIQCEKLYPVLEVQIGKLMEQITSVEENCNIRAEGNRILLK